MAISYLTSIIAKKNTEHLIVTASSLFVGVGSLFSYALLAVVLPETELARFISITAFMALLQIALIPNAMLHVYSARRTRLQRKYFFYSVQHEILGLIVGGAIIYASAMFMGEVLAEYLSAYLALGLAGSTAVTGLLRARAAWKRYFLYFTSSVLVRLGVLGFIVANPSIEPTLLEILLYGLLLPELIRYVCAVPALIYETKRRLVAKHFYSTTRALYRNWVFDVGSGINEVGDRALLSMTAVPGVLIVYFFARRLGAINTIVVEPLYAINFRSQDFSSESIVRRLYRNGVCLSVAITSAVSILVALVMSFEYATPRLPSSFLDYWWVFFMVLGADSVACANRITRFLTLKNGNVGYLLLMRIFNLCIFGALTILVGGVDLGINVMIGFFTYVLIDILIVRFFSGMLSQK